MTAPDSCRNNLDTAVSNSLIRFCWEATSPSLSDSLVRSSSTAVAFGVAVAAAREVVDVLSACADEPLSCIRLNKQ
jgi:hypothetical protein